jgi:FkbM family methyltransferase
MSRWAPTRLQQLGRQGLGRARREAEARFAAWALDTGLRLDRSERAGELRQIAEVGPRRELRDRQGMSVLLASILRRDGSAIDVGAHSGAVLREILRVAPEGRHIAYEPLPVLARQLTAEFPGVEVRNAALSDTNGSVDFIHVEAAPELSGMRERDYGAYADTPRTTITVRTERLDDVLPAGFVPDLIKIDVEGAELLVLRGAVETLRRHRPAVVFEHGIGAADRYGYGPEDVYDLLVGDIGLRIFDLDGAGPYPRERFVEIFPEPLWNFLAVP